MKKILTTFLIILAVLVVTVLIAAGAFLIKWLDCARTKSTPEIAAVLFDEKDILIGDKLNCTFKVRTSWSLMPVSAEITPAEGIQEGETVKITPGNWQWGTRIWNVAVQVQPFRDGTYRKIPVRILCEGGPDGKSEVKTAIPGFKVELPETTGGTDLNIAEQLPERTESAPRKKMWIWILSGAILILIFLILLFFHFKKRKKNAPVPAWIAALDDISDLRRALHKRGITNETAVIRLTNVVRHFLEEQFFLRAERQTTSEFLESLRRDHELLDVEQRRFLREFLSSADMIKFARVEADEALFENAAGQAESLIKSTAQDAERKEKLS